MKGKKQRRQWSLWQSLVCSTSSLGAVYLYGTGRSHPHTCRYLCPLCWRLCCCGTSGSHVLCCQCSCPQKDGSCLIHCSGWTACIVRSVCYLPSPVINSEEEIIPIRMVTERLCGLCLYTVHVASLFSVLSYESSPSQEQVDGTKKAKKLSRAKYHVSKSLHWYQTVCMETWSVALTSSRLLW